MITDLKRDIIAIILSVFIIGVIVFKTYMPDAFASKSAPTLSLEEASERLERIISNGGTYITSFDSHALEPVVYEALVIVTDIKERNL
ncbi:hypothetical protein MHH56_18545 [Paenibacillus sp. FSL K6-3182]|uniref:hypothetical protein n=1 Tax=Paenibacillus sp. FSL K6-3182 TaxID=2921495 RepID=UPI0030CD74E9